MSKGKYASKRSRSSKSLVLVLALVMLITDTVGGTLAWLGDKTETVKNTFSASGIDIKLEEHVYDDDTNTLKLNDQTTTVGNANYNMVPGWIIPKDPTVTVLANSEPCYLFIEVTKDGNFDKYIASQIDAGWTQGNTTNQVPSTVYYRLVGKDDEAQSFGILAGGTYQYKEITYTWVANELLVKPEITQADMANAAPSISFIAYAVQQYKDYNDEFTPKQAWDLAKEMAPVTTP